MPTFVFAYRRTPGSTPAPTPESTAAWQAWFDAMGDDLVDLGKPAAGAAALEHALAFHPHDPGSIHLSLATVYDGLGDRQRAAAHRAAATAAK